MKKKSYDIDFFKALATKKGGKCLSNDYTTLSIKLEWQCKKGHIFKLAPQKILTRNYWCAECTGRRTLHTLESIQKIAKERGWKFLSSEFSVGHKKYKFQCPRGHISNILANNFIKGSACRTCSGKRILTIDVFKEIASAKGGTCLSKKYGGQQTKLNFRCKEGHLFELAPQKILDRNYWCAECTGRRTINTLESIQKIAQKRGWKFLSPKFTVGYKKYKFQCNNGHISHFLADNFLRGVGCRTCSGRQLLTIDLFREIAAKKGGECLSRQYKGQHTKLKFICKNGHVFETVPGIVKNNNTWCKKCAGLETGTIEEMREIAKSKGGECLSREYVNNSTKLKWKCSDNHVWEANPRDVKHKSWCPHCTWYMGESKSRHILERLLSTEFNKTRAILSNRLELDGYSKNLSLAFEYNGGQHYKKVAFFNKQRTFQQIRKSDQIKKRECASKKIKLIVIPYYKSNTDLELITFIKHRLNKLSISHSDLSPKSLMKNFYLNNSSLLKVQELVHSKEGVLLSNEYSNVVSKLTVRCKNGHSWDTNYTLLKLGKWCDTCSERASIKEIQKIAQAKNGRLLSVNLKNSSTLSNWKCEKGHVWEATPNSIKRGTWCPTCAGKVKLTIELMKELAQRKGGKCLSSKYFNNSTKLLWECRYGHRWEAQPQHIKNKDSWCPKCQGKY